MGDVSLDSWACLDGMINVVRRTGHSSFYVEKGMGAIGKTPQEMGIRSEYTINGGGEPGRFLPVSAKVIHCTCSLSHLVAGESVIPF